MASSGFTSSDDIEPSLNGSKTEECAHKTSTTFLVVLVSCMYHVCMYVYGEYGKKKTAECELKPD